jgi:MFS family permease
MNDSDANKTLIGVNHSCHYLGLAIASLSVPLASRRLGPRCAAIGMLACGPTLALFPAAGPVGWSLLRLLNGAASAWSLVPLETMVSRGAHPSRRTRDFAIFGVALTLGGAVGMWAGLHLYDFHAVLGFLVGGLAPVVGGLALVWKLPLAAPQPGSCATPSRLPWRTHLLSFGTAWSQGFLEGGMLAFLALYLKTRGFSADQAGDLLALTTIGVLVFQVPVSWIADRCGRVPVLLGCYGVVIAGLAAAPYCPGTISLASCLFVFGACAGAMYPLGLSLLGDGLGEGALARLYAWYLAMECAGSLMGPPAMGGGIDVWGESAMFAVGLAALGFVLALWTALRRKAEPEQTSLPACEQIEPRRVA